MIDMFFLYFYVSVLCIDKFKENNIIGRNINYNKVNKFWYIRYM